MRRGIIFGAIAIAVVVTALWWLFIVSPRNEEIDDINQRLDAAEAQEDSLQTQIRQLTSIKDQEVSYLFAIGQMETSIPESPEEAAFIDQINFLADRTGVDLMSLTLAPPTQPIEEGASGFEIPTRISVEGQYFEVLGFLYGLEALERLVRVDTLNISPQAPVSDDEEQETPPDDSDDIPDDPDIDVDPTEEPRPRPEQTMLTVDVGAVLFTRTQVQLDPEEIAGIIGEAGGEEEAEGEGTSEETTTTTTTPTDATTTTTVDSGGGDE